MTKKLTSLALMLAFSFAAKAAGPSACATVIRGETAVGFDSSRTWTEQVFLKNLNVLSDFFKTNEKLTSDELVDQMINTDLRRVVFNIEGFAKFYEARDSKFFGKIRRDSTTLEDALGDLSLYDSMIERSKVLKSPEITQFFQDKKAQQKIVLLDALKSFDLLKNPDFSIKQMIKDIESYDGWRKPRKDREIYVELLSNQVKVLEKRIEKREFSTSDLDRGLHALKRRIREFLIAVSAFERTVAYQDETDVKPEVEQLFQKLLISRPNIFDNKMKLAPSEVRDPVLIPRKHYAMINEINQQLGAIKDQAEFQHLVVDALKKLQLPEDQEKQILTRLNKELGPAANLDILKTVNSYQNMINDTKLLKRFRKALKAMN